METNKEIVTDLEDLLSIVNDGKEGYESSAEATESMELKAVFGKFAAERALYATELKAHIATHGGDADNESGGIAGAFHRTWLNVKQALSSKEDAAILDSVVTGEKAAIEKFDKYIADYTDHADHLQLLTKQRDGIQAALTQIETLKAQYSSAN
jgi:uncharacterized protein (TIGR02284 family)